MSKGVARCEAFVGVICESLPKEIKAVRETCLPTPVVKLIVFAEELGR